MKVYYSSRTQKMLHQGQLHCELDEAFTNNGSTKPIQFDWNTRWLKGHQYSHILNNIDAYCEQFEFQKYQYKEHPLEIYEHPRNGTIYFVKGGGVGSDFGFPRISMRKKYRWKKMNFTTNLPKKQPHVTYVVASALKCQPLGQADTPQFRMHAVIPYQAAKSETKSRPCQYILCHIRQVEQKPNSQESEAIMLESCFHDGHIDFYLLLGFLHNLQLM